MVSGPNAAFVARMEAVLDVYARPFDPRRPLVCFDEGGKELQRDTRPSLPTIPKHAAKIDYEYARHGSANLFLWVAPLLGRRGVTITERRTRIEFAAALKDLVDVQFPDAEQIVLVLDNLNTHDPASLYAAYPPAEAKRIWEKLELHHTPKHGSWLNCAEIELSVLARQCLDRRIPDRATLEREVAAWVANRNARQIGVRWQFTTDHARTKLATLYPVPQLANS
jgi:hypothetical protein